MTTDSDSVPPGPSPVRGDALDEFLAATQVGRLAELRDRIGPTDADVAARVQHVVDHWDDEQAVSNVLMYPDLLAPVVRVPVIVRGLEDLGYLQVAAAAGSARLPAPIGEEDRVALVDALLDLVAGQVGLAAQLGARVLGGVARSTDAAEIVVLLGHPDDEVRNVAQSTVIEMLSARGLDELLDDREQVRAEDAEVARAELAADGVDLAAYAPSALAAAPFVPDYQDFTED